MDRAAQQTAAGSVRHQRGLRDLSLIPCRWNFDELRALEFTHLQTSLAQCMPPGCDAAGTSLWYCSNSLLTIMIEFDWNLQKGANEPIARGMEWVRSNLVPCRDVGGRQTPLDYIETQLCLSAILVWLDWERDVLSSAISSTV